jgi:sphinganine-1-phosphate aldolase
MNVYQVMELLSQKGWYLNGLQDPPGVHLAVTLRHAPAPVVRRFLEDLRWALQKAPETPEGSGMAPVYGLASSLPEDSLEAFLGSVIDWMSQGP